MNYPPQLSFKIVVLTPQIAVTDANGNFISYVKQRLLKLKECITVFADAEQIEPLYSINTDRVVDFLAGYHFTDQNRVELASVKRQGRKSLWKAHYDILDGDRTVMTITEENPWVKVLDGLVGQIPVIGMFTG